MSTAFWLALRHLAKARREGFLARVSLLALLGVAVGVATLLTVFAFVQGFQIEVRNLLTGMNPAVFVSSRQRGEVAEPYALGDSLIRMDEIVGASPFVQQKGVLSLRSGNDLRLRGVILRGIDPEREKTVTDLIERSDPPFASFALPGLPPGILLGARLAEELGALPGEEITFTTVLDETDREPRHFPFFVVGLVESGLYEFDRRFAYMDASLSRRLFRGDLGVDGLGLRIDDVMGAESVARELRATLPYPRFQAASWMELNGEIFRWMGTMRAILFLALSLIILVAGFNIAGAMTIIVTEKTREIGLLLSLGATRREVLTIFLLEGWLIGLAGVIAGGLLGLLCIAWFTRHPLGLPGEIYFIDRMPVSLSPTLFLTIAGAAVGVALIALILPGLEAMRRTPMDALREGAGIRA